MLRPTSRSESRKKTFKKAIDGDEARRKREDGMIRIRKDKREEAFQKKRRWAGLIFFTQFNTNLSFGYVRRSARASVYSRPRREAGAGGPSSSFLTVCLGVCLRGGGLLREG